MPRSLRDRAPASMPVALSLGLALALGLFASASLQAAEGERSRASTGLRNEAPPPPEARGNSGWSNIFRFATSALGGGARRPSSAGATATIGVRGLDAARIAMAAPDDAAVQAMDSLAVAPAEAADFARAALLATQSLPLPPSR